MKKKVSKKSKESKFWKATPLDIAFTKLAIFFGTLFLVYIFPQFFSTFEDFKWLFLVFALIFSIKPLRSYFSK